MAFNNAYLGRVDVALNNSFTVNYTSGAGTPSGALGVFEYNGLTVGDAMATIIAANYFLSAVRNFQVGTVIFITATDSSGMYVVDAVTYPDSDGVGGAISVASYAANGSVATANIQDHAVTYVKMQEQDASSLLGNSTGAQGNVEAVTLGNGLEFAATALQVPVSNLVYATGSISAIQWAGMYATPLELVGAAGAATLLSVADFVLEVEYGTTQYAAGGAVAVQYDSTANGAGAPASASIAAATINGYSADAVIGVSGSLASATAAATVNKGLYLSNASGAFTTGDSTFVYHLWYRQVATSF